MIDLHKCLEKGKIEKVIAGGSNGSIILMDIINDDKKYILYIYCTWRLSFKNEVITGCNDESVKSDSIFVIELKKLENDFIYEIIIKSFGDFTIVFRSGKKLDVFSDITSNGGDNDVIENWTICDIHINKCYNFTNRYKIDNESFNDVNNN